MSGVIPAALPLELVLGAVALVAVLTLARWGWNARGREAALPAWLEQARREQEGREAFDAKLEEASGAAGRRVLERRARRLRDEAER